MTFETGNVYVMSSPTVVLNRRRQLDLPMYDITQSDVRDCVWHPNSCFVIEISVLS